MSGERFSRTVGDTGLRIWSMHSREFVLEVPGLPGGVYLSADDCTELGRIADLAATCEVREQAAGELRTSVRGMERTLTEELLFRQALDEVLAADDRGEAA